jgi:epoxyqueuosine reductase
MWTNKSSLGRLIKEKAKEIGFSSIGFAKASHMDAEAGRLEKWLNQNHHGQMDYLARHFDLRTDPRKLVEGAKTVISLTYNYYTPPVTKKEETFNVSMYANGRDYHKVIKKRLKTLFEYIRQTAGNVQGRFFVDSGPVLERDWAKRAGLGWMGKNTMLIHPKAGSWFFLAEIILDLELEPDIPLKDYCGTCKKCIEACPTEAFSKEGYILDASKCISYLTIELKGDIPEMFSGKFQEWIFGCDICQQVCPWNKFASPHNEPEFIPKEQVAELSKQAWRDMTEPVFQKLFEGSALKRTKFEGMKRNIIFADKKT